MDVTAEKEGETHSSTVLSSHSRIASLWSGSVGGLVSFVSNGMLMLARLPISFASVGALSLGRQCGLTAEARIHRRPVVSRYPPRFPRTASHLIPWSSRVYSADQQVL